MDVIERRALRVKAWNDAIETALAELPSSWLDPMLTGPKAVLKGSGGTWGCPDVEAVIRGVKARLEALKRTE